MKSIIAAGMLTAAVPAYAEQPKEVLMVWGDFGKAMMVPLANAVTANGYRVTLISHAGQVPNRKWYAAISHSAGDRKALGSGAPIVITLDPTYLNPGCQPGAACLNYYNPANKWMFFGACCGGFQVSGAKNYVVDIRHVDFPRMMKTSVVRALS